MNLLVVINRKYKTLYGLVLTDAIIDFQIVILINFFKLPFFNGFFKEKQCDVLVGASGTFETFHEMINHQRFSGSCEAQEMDMQDIAHTLDWVIHSTKLERNHHPYIIPIRRKMAPISAVKTRWIMNQLLVKKVFVSPCSIKEGVLIVR